MIAASPLPRRWKGRTRRRCLSRPDARSIVAIASTSGAGYRWSLATPLCGSCTWVALETGPTSDSGSVGPRNFHSMHRPEARGATMLVRRADVGVCARSILWQSRCHRRSVSVFTAAFAGPHPSGVKRWFSLPLSPRCWDVNPVLGFIPGSWQ